MDEDLKVSRQELETVARAIVLELNMQNDPKYTQDGEGDTAFGTTNPEQAYYMCQDFPQGGQKNCYADEKAKASIVGAQGDVRFPRYSRREHSGQGVRRQTEAAIDERESFSAPMLALNHSEAGAATDNSSYRIETVSRIKTSGMSTEQLSEAFCRDARRYDSAFERFR